MKIGVLSFPGTLDHDTTARAVVDAGHEAVALWYSDEDVSGVDAIIIPGGTTYGDYLRAGAIAALEPVMQQVRLAAEAGVPIMGIGNGFQILVEAGLLPGAFTLNDTQVFVRADQELVVESVNGPWLKNLTAGETIVLPLRAKEGRYVLDDATLAEVEDAGQVALRYAGANPNGSSAAIAGITNTQGNVLGLMVHPEHAVELGFGPDTSERMRSGIDGRAFFMPAA